MVRACKMGFDNARAPNGAADKRSQSVSNVAQVRTPDKVLTEILRTLRIAQHARNIFETFPSLRSGTENLAWHLTDRVMWPEAHTIGSNTPLIHTCLTTAIEWLNYRASLPNPTIKGGMTSFAAGLLYHTSELIHVEVRDPETEAIWDPFNDEALATWLPKHPQATVGNRKYLPTDVRWDDRAIRTSMLRMMFPNGTWAFLQMDLEEVLVPPETIIPPRAR